MLYSGSTPSTSVPDNNFYEKSLQITSKIIWLIIWSAMQVVIVLSELTGDNQGQRDRLTVINSYKRKKNISVVHFILALMYLHVCNKKI